ncbi:hypothetical protein FOZ63_014540, partial [Perkinsus olseni]
MSQLVYEYDPSDTPSGFLRWSNPTTSKPSRARRLLQSLKAASIMFTPRDVLTVALVSALVSVFFIWYSWTLLTISYRLSSVLDITIQRVSMKQVWCGMITLERDTNYCARGTIDLRIRNGLLTDLTILSAELSTSVQSMSSANHLVAGFLQIGGVVVRRMSDGVYTLPVSLSSLSHEDLWHPNVSRCDAQLDLYALGYHFDRLDFGILQIAAFNHGDVEMSNSTTRMIVAPRRAQGDLEAVAFRRDFVSGDISS